MRERRNWTTGIGALGLAATLSACGSTVATTQAGGAAQGSLVQGLDGGAAAANTSGLGAAAGSTPVDALAGSAGRVAGGAATTATGGPQNVAVTNPAVGGSAPRSGGGSAALQGVGVTPTTIEVGITYISNGDAANAALGASGVTTGDTKADAQAVIDDINAHGGVAGRKLHPTFHAYDANSADTRASQDQAACADFVQDHHVFAVLGGGFDNLASCLSKAGVIQVSSGLMDLDRADFSTLPYLFELGVLMQERMMADEVTTLQRLGYFTKWDHATGKPGAMPVKVGILSVDVPEWERPLQKVLVPALARVGFPVAAADIFRIHNPNSTAEDGQTVNDVQSATLKFRGDNVTHVILLDANGSLTLLFAKDAASQGYLPRYGVNSASGIQALYDSGVIDNNQLNGAAGLGWVPSLDLSAAAGDKYKTAATKHCLQVMKDRTGQTYDSTNAASIALSYCDMGYLIAKGLTDAGRSLTKDTVRAAIEGLGSSLASAGLPESFFGPGRHDQVQRGYDMVWDTSCTCAKYKGQHEIPS